MLYNASQLNVLPAWIQDLGQVLPYNMGWVLTKHFDDDAHTNDGVLVKGIAAANSNESIHVDMVNEDVALKDGADENGHAAQVFVILTHQYLLDVFGDSSVDIILFVLFSSKAFSLKEEVKIKDVTQVISWNISLVDLAQASDVDTSSISKAKSVQQVYNFMEVFSTIFVDGSNCT